MESHQPTHADMKAARDQAETQILELHREKHQLVVERQTAQATLDAHLAKLEAVERKLAEQKGKLDGANAGIKVSKLRH